LDNRNSWRLIQNGISHSSFFNNFIREETNGASSGSWCDF